jgi:hypothetical protein
VALCHFGPWTCKLKKGPLTCGICVTLVHELANSKKRSFNFVALCHFGPWTFQNRSNYPQANLKRRICYSCFAFSFLFILAESLKNHSKSQKNHKIENTILLDSTWVDLHSEHIIWYALVQSFCYIFWSIFSYNLDSNFLVLKHTILNVHCVDLLI